MDDYTSLICEIKSGSRTAFNTLYRIHYPGLLAYAELFLDEGGAEDVIQDVFLNVWINRDNLNDSSSLKGYLLRSVYNTSLNYLKKEKYARKYSSEYQQQIEELGYLFYDPESNETIQKLYSKDLHKEIQAAIDALPPKCREVFSLSYLGELSNKEIAQQLGISVSTVENHIHSALKQLRIKLGA
ncbi:RNA polymerase sigma-70 factor, partial [Macellibacteroides fermentans]|uniref:RNA polymerase sigma-70 factor n=1 Tax=Macellibacteroides fermentans TaxID=879969 RepID=UPI00406C57A7